MSDVTANLTVNTTQVTFAGTVSGEPVTATINVAPRGPAGTDGSNSITSATTSDGTANLDVLSVVSDSLESTFDTIIGGALYFQGGSLTKLQAAATEPRFIFFPMRMEQSL